MIQHVGAFLTGWVKSYLGDEKPFQVEASFAAVDFVVPGDAVDQEIVAP